MSTKHPHKSGYSEGQHRTKVEITLIISSHSFFKSSWIITLIRLRPAMSVTRFVDSSALRYLPSL